MTVHLEALDLWEAVKEDYDVSPLLANPTVAQLKSHKEKKTKKSKAKAYLFSVVSKHNIHKNYELGVYKGHLGLPQKEIPRQ